MSGQQFRPNFHVESFLRSLIQEYKRATTITEVSYLETIFMSGRWFRPKFQLESFSRSIIQESHIIHRSELSGDHFQEISLISSKFSCREFLEISNTREPHHSQKWAIWRPFSWVGDDFVQTFYSRVSWDLWYKRATSITEVSYLETIFMSGLWFRRNFNVESFLRSLIQERHIYHRSELSGDHFHEWATISSKFSCREFLEIFNTRVQESHNDYRRELSGDHFFELVLISSKFSTREFLVIYNTREPHQSKKWAIWRQFSWVGDDFVEIFISRVSRDLYYKRATSFTEVSYLKTIFMSGRWFRPNFHVESFFRFIVQKSPTHHRSGLSGDHFHEWAMISFKFSCREFLEIFNTREPHHSQKWAIWRPFSWVGDDFVQTFYSRVSWDLWYKRATSIREVSYLETIFMSGRWFRPKFQLESFSRSIKQESHIIHRSELSGDHFQEISLISSKFSCREFLEISNTREPHHSQKWAIWRPFSWVGNNFVQIFMSRVSWDL